MADNSTLNAGSGGDVIRSNDRSAVKTPVVMLDIGSDSVESIVDGTALTPAALVPVGGKAVTIIVTPTVQTAAYVAKDAVGGLLTFANAARISGGTITLDAVTIVDKAQVMLSLDLVLFNVTLTAPTDSSAFDPTDAELLTCCGVVPISTWTDFTDNSVAHRSGLGMTMTLAGTSLFGVLVARSSGTLVGSSDIQVMLAITQN
jgi:hypothetical protein